MIEPHEIDLKLLAVFQEVYRERQISNAARRLNLSQSAVSNALARLRRLFGDSSESPYDRINQLLEKAGIGASTRFRVPHFTAVPYIVQASDLVVTVPQKLAERAGPPFGLAWITPPLTLPPLQTNMFWHRRYNQDPGNQWLRGLVAGTFAQ